MSLAPLVSPGDTPEVRKLRGAFFTPDAVTRFITDWAIRKVDDRVLEPSAGDAAFLVEAVRRLRELGAKAPVVNGVEIHSDSARVAASRVAAAGGHAELEVSDLSLIHI